MTNSQRLTAVREMLRTWYQDRAPEADWEVTESIMIRDGFYCGRNFRFADHRAVWFVEEEQVKIYGSDRALLESFSTVDLEAPVATVKLHTVDEPEMRTEPQPAGEEMPIRRAA